MYKDIVLLTKSKKMQGYCIAGIDTENGEWIRLGEANGPSVTPEHFKYDSGREPEILDTIRVRVIEPDPSLLHPEDVIIDTEEITHLGCDDLQYVARRVEDDHFTHEHVYHNTYPKLLDRKLPKDAIDSPYSLMIIEPENLVFRRIEHKEIKGIRIDAEFDWKGRHYSSFRVTDIDFLKRLESIEPMQAFKLREPVYLVISLGESFVNPGTGEAEYYKLVASIIDKKRIVAEIEKKKEIKDKFEKLENCNQADTYQKAIIILEQIAKGIDPYTGKILPEDSICNKPDTIRSLFTAVKVLEEKCQEKAKKKGKKKDFWLTEDEREHIEFSENPIPISRITERINEAKTDPHMKKLSYKTIVDWLIREGFVEERTTDGKKVKYPTQKGESIGISVERRMTQRGQHYYVTLYNPMAQRFIIDNLDSIIG